MPGENIQAWSTTAASNGNADTSINWAEGQARASVNDSARSMMAAHAKNRNLQNGSIVTSGTVNAHAFFSGLDYITVPTGLRVLLKIGPSLTNTAAATLNMDNIGAVAIKDNLAAVLIGGELVAGAYREFLYDGTNWILLDNTGGGVSPSSGRLQYVSATSLSFKPFNGDRVRINGATFPIPSAGIAGLASTTSVFVNGVAAQPLVADTAYFVYVFNNAGVLTADFSTTGHSTSATAGNTGTEIKTSDDSRTLIGMAVNHTAVGFHDAETFRGVLSWFNATTKTLRGTSTGGIPVASAVAVELLPAARIYFLTWGAGIQFGILGSMTTDTAATIVTPGLYLDGTTSILTAGATLPTASQYYLVSGNMPYIASEGLHFATPMGLVSAGTGTFFFGATAMLVG